MFEGPSVPLYSNNCKFADFYVDYWMTKIFFLLFSSLLPNFSPIHDFVFVHLVLSFMIAYHPRNLSPPFLVIYGLDLIEEAIRLL